MWDALHIQYLGKVLGNFNRGGANQHWLTLLVQFFDLLGDRPEFALGGAIDQVGLVSADHGLMRWDNYNVELIDFVEFFSLGQRGTRHA